MYTNIVIQPKFSYLKQPSFPAVLNSEKGVTPINLMLLWILLRFHIKFLSFWLTWHKLITNVVKFYKI